MHFVFTELVGTIIGEFVPDLLASDVLGCLINTINCEDAVLQAAWVLVVPSGVQTD